MDLVVCKPCGDHPGLTWAVFRRGTLRAGSGPTTLKGARERLAGAPTPSASAFGSIG